MRGCAALLDPSQIESPRSDGGKKQTIGKL
jgi:hypothetical protein